MTVCLQGHDYGAPLTGEEVLVWPGSSVFRISGRLMMTADRHHDNPGPNPPINTLVGNGGIDSRPEFVGKKLVYAFIGGAFRHRLPSAVVRPQGCHQ